MLSTAHKSPAVTQRTASYFKSAICISAALLMNACATQNASNANAGYSTPNMNRTISERISDELIERTSHKNLANISGVGEHNVRIAINSFRREVLLTGEVPSEKIKADVENMVSSINDVKAVYNYLVVTSTPKAQSHTLHENYLKSRIIAKIVSAGGVKSSQYKLVVRDNMAYLLGFLTVEQEQAVVSTIASVKGMEGVRVLSTRVRGDVSTLTTNANYAINDAEEDPSAGGMVYGGGASAVYPTPTIPTATYPQSMHPNTSGTGYADPNVGTVATNAYYPSGYPNTNYPTNAYPTNPNGATTGYNPNVPVVKMEGNPTSTYVNLYNNTSKP